MQVFVPRTSGSQPAPFFGIGDNEDTLLFSRTQFSLSPADSQVVVTLIDDLWTENKQDEARTFLIELLGEYTFAMKVKELRFVSRVESKETGDVLMDIVQKIPALPLPARGRP